MVKTTLLSVICTGDATKSTIGAGYFNSKHRNIEESSVESSSLIKCLGNTTLKRLFEWNGMKIDHPYKANITALFNERCQLVATITFGPNH